MTATTNVRREERTITGAGTIKLFERRWLPAGPTTATILLIHGFGEHTGRYDFAGDWLARRGWAVRGFDLRGHGLSDGRRAAVATYREYLDDLRTYLPRVQSDAVGTPIYLLGHSMGGCITTLWLAVDRPPVAGAILSGAVLPRDGWRTPVFRLVKALGSRLPGIPLTALDAADVSRDPEIVRRYDADPLVYRGRLRAGHVASTLRAVERIERDAARIDMPLLILHGEQDALTSPDGSRWLYEHVSSTDRTLKTYDGLYHEILNEPEREQVLADMDAWLDARSVSRSAGSLGDAAAI